MWFKNLQIYRLPANWAMTAEKLAEYLAPQAFSPCTSNELLRQGWVSPRDNGQLVHTVNRQMLLCLQTEKKLLPASVINQVAKAKAAELEEAQGFAPGRKAMKELKERVADELLPRAFGILACTFAWIDPVNGWLVVDAASASNLRALVAHRNSLSKRNPSMNNAGSSRRGIQMPVPAPISKRVKCAQCTRTKSIGQYPVGSNTCASCKPQGKAFRRGGL